MEQMNKSTDRSAAWPAQCCVPAFLWRAIQWFAARPDLNTEPWKRRAAECLGVVVGPTDSNPWDLPISDDPEQWGVTPPRAAERFAGLESLAGLGMSLDLEIVRANEIPFSLYEDAIVDLGRAGAVVAIGYD